MRAMRAKSNHHQGGTEVSGRAIKEPRASAYAKVSER